VLWATGNRHIMQLAEDGGAERDVSNEEAACARWPPGDV
jgi:hypothetical protein